MDSTYTFNTTDYEFVVRLYNGVHDIYLKPEAWENLMIEEDIFDWKIKGSIEINASYESFERESENAVTLFGDKTKMIYKFRNDGRDTIYIYIRPKNNGPLQAPSDFEHKFWGIEIEGAIYDVRDYQSTNITNKVKKLFFWDKTYQMMLEKNIEFSTAIVGSNKGKGDPYKLNNVDRALKTGEAIGELLKTDEEFSKHSKLVDDPKEWSLGDEKNKIFYSSPTNSSFTDDLDYLLMQHTSDKSEKFQPCIFRFERNTKKGEPKQFSLKSLKKYFERAGKASPGEYQVERLVFEESNMDHKDSVPIMKVPQQTSFTGNFNNNVTAEDFSVVKNYKIVDLAGVDNALRLYNRFISSHNTKKGQISIEIKEHKAEKYKEFYKENIVPNILTEQGEERLPLTNYIKTGYNSRYHFSTADTEESRIADGRNKLLNYYLFSNLGIAFSVRGMTIRQPGRFFGLSRNTKNDREYDHKLEGQYFSTNVIHHFSNQNRSYWTQVVGVKVHTFKEETKLPDDDLILI